jgi:hypothetical protein
LQGCWQDTRNNYKVKEDHYHRWGHCSLPSFYYHDKDHAAVLIAVTVEKQIKK